MRKFLLLSLLLPTFAFADAGIFSPNLTPEVRERFRKVSGPSSAEESVRPSSLSPGVRERILKALGPSTLSPEQKAMYLRIAEQGNAKAQYNLGKRYEDGDGFPRDYAKAVKWYRKSAEQDNAQAQGKLGNMYSAGKGVPQDDKQAYIWLSIAATRDTEFASMRDWVAYRKLSPEQRVEFQALAVELHQKIQASQRPWFWEKNK